MTKISLIIGSTRQNRAADKVAEWVTGQISLHDTLELEIIDLAQEDLPFFVAPTPPSYAPDQSPHALAWGKKVAATDHIIFLTAEYNRGIPAALKNAIDYLKSEWEGKPAAIISYGFIDGGLSATRHLQDVLGWLKVRVVPTTIQLQLTRDMLGADGTIADPVSSFAGYNEQMNDMLDELLAAEARAVT